MLILQVLLAWLLIKTGRELIRAASFNLLNYDPSKGIGVLFVPVLGADGDGEGQLKVSNPLLTGFIPRNVSLVA